MPESRRIRILLHALAGGLLVVVSLAADPLLGTPASFGPLQRALLLAGLAVAAAGWLHLGRLSTDLSLLLLAVLVPVGVAEGLFRAVGFDFARRAWLAVPPYYRQPTVPHDEAFFRRPGPERWTGRVLHTRLRQLGIEPNPYGDAPVITVAYDRLGFRNPEAMADWEIAVTGDSFTELGYLPQEQLFTTILGRLLGAPVRNLGTSYTGPLTQLSYLRAFGVSPGTRRTVLVFYEGNDLKNLADERAALERFRRTGKRDTREIEGQTSLLRELRGRLARALSPPVPPGVVTATFASAEGEIPVTLYHAPPGRADLAEETLERLDRFLEEYAAFGRQRRIGVSLAYMPCKSRVLNGRLTFAPDAPAEIRAWRPTDLPDVVSDLCRRHGVAFLDLTRALAAESGRSGRLLYNPIYDTHLDAAGAQVVARELARHLAP